MNGGGYRVSIWNMNRQQNIEMISQLELELQANALSIYLLPVKGKFKPADESSGMMASASQSLFATLKFLTLERHCIKIWSYSQGSAELLKKI